MGGDWGTVIRFGTYNIRNGRNGGITSALQGMPQANLNLWVFQEINVVDGIHTCASAGYYLFTTNAPSQYCGGVAIFYWESSTSKSRHCSLTVRT